ncbi:MAG: hypothetical protein AABM66_10240 [Actinomycetota bacterium]
MPAAELEPIAVLARLERWGAARAWIGPDPYEGLSSPLGRLAPGRRTRQAVTQLYKRLPFAPPWPLRAPPSANAKALALVLSGYATAAGRRLPGADEHLARLPRELERLNLLTEGAGWGYPFEVQTRNVRYSRTTPNAIATCFVVGALVDAHLATREEPTRALALAARPFLLSLGRESPGHGPFFGYIPAEAPLVHNANLLVCGTLARLHELEPDEAARPVVEAAAQTTLSLVRDDGLWPYGELPNFGWVDNFHTAYTLEGLAQVSLVFGIGAETLARGASAWRERFVEPDGWTPYYPDRRFPLEAHCCASAIDLVLTLEPKGAEPDWGDLARSIADTAIRELWMPDADRFAFRRTAWRLNGRAFMRWTNAPMFRALGRLVDRYSRAAPVLNLQDGAKRPL